jgi:hypothetical protein
MRTVKMYGPSLSDPSKTVNRDVPEADVQAYRAAGYTEGSIEQDVEVVVEVAAEEETKDAPKAKPRKKGKK